MSHKNPEFLALFEASGWSQAEVARYLKLDRATVSRYLKEGGDSIETPANVTELFKFVLASRKPGALTAVASTQSEDYEVLRDAPIQSDLETWRRRAKEAELIIAELREGLRHLLEKSGSHPASSSARKGNANKIEDIILEDLEAQKHGTPRSKGKP